MGGGWGGGLELGRNSESVDMDSKSSTWWGGPNDSWANMINKCNEEILSISDIDNTKYLGVIVSYNPPLSFYTLCYYRYIMARAVVK